jgi:hypothetical protein
MQTTAANRELASLQTIRETPDAQGTTILNVRRADIRMAEEFLNCAYQKKAVHIAAVDVTADHGYASRRLCLWSSRSFWRYEDRRGRTQRSSLRYWRCGTNCRCCSERGLGGCGSRRRPLALDMAVPLLDRVAHGARHRQTRNDPRLALPRRSGVLDMEEPPTALVDRPYRPRCAD